MSSQAKTVKGILHGYWFLGYSLLALVVASMLVCAFGFLNATEAAVSQEFIDAFAILWALVPAVSKLSRSPHSV